MLEMILFDHGEQWTTVRMVLLSQYGATQLTIESFTNGTISGTLHLHGVRPFSSAMGEPGQCDILNGPCYQDGSYLQGRRILEDAIEHGEDAIWAELAEYQSYFTDQGPDPIALYVASEEA